MAKPKPSGDHKPEKQRLVTALTDLSGQIGTMLPVLLRARFEFESKMGNHELLGEFDELTIDLASINVALKNTLKFLRPQKRSAQSQSPEELKEQLAEAKFTWQTASGRFDEIMDEEILSLFHRITQKPSGRTEEETQFLLEKLLKELKTAHPITEDVLEKAANEMMRNLENPTHLLVSYENRLQQFQKQLGVISVKLPDTLNWAKEFIHDERFLGR